MIAQSFWLENSKKELTCWCPHTPGTSCHYRTPLRSKRRPIWSDPKTEKMTTMNHMTTPLTGRKCDILSRAIKTPDSGTLLMNAGAASGLLLNSPHTCKSLTQQMASLSSAKVWEPVISSVAWGLMKLNCGRKWHIGKLCNSLEEGVVTVTAVTHFFKDIWVENIDGENDLPLWDHVLLWFGVLANGQTLLGVKHTGEKLFKGAYRSALQHFN